MPVRSSIRICRVVMLGALPLLFLSLAQAETSPWAILEKQFREMPMEARRQTGPLFWLHGDENETPERLKMYLEKVAEGHNGTFCAESRPHSDWLGPRWFDDLAICLQAAKDNDLKMWIFDEKWWPSQTLGGEVPERYGAKKLTTDRTDLAGPAVYETTLDQPERLVALIAARIDGEALVGDSLTDLSGHLENGRLRWTAPEGQWAVIRFDWTLAPAAGQGGDLTVDGASQDCVDWFIETVYQPHYDRFKDDFGKTIVGFFYDEPETRGDWGTEVPKVLSERGIDYHKALVAWKFKLAGDDGASYRYQYADAFFEAWGRVMYGSMLKWCEERGVASIGHFMEHDGLYLKHGLGAGDLFKMQKYNSMGGIDLVVHQMYPGQEPAQTRGTYHLPKIASSISHAYNKKDHLAMCEIFGGYDQRLTYPVMKWLTDQHQVRGLNFMITHSFNPKAPNDTDYPPYFYNDGLEPRWPLYRVWADYTNRLSLLLTGGRHVCPVAILYPGASAYAGQVVTPEDITYLFQRNLYDTDWVPYEVIESGAITGDTPRRVALAIHEEAYRILVVPPIETMPYTTLAKVKAFLEAGGVVIGFAAPPTRSATPGKTADDMKALVESIWGTTAPNLLPRHPKGMEGVSFLLPPSTDREQLHEILSHKALRLDRDIEGALTNTSPQRPEHNLRALRRVKEGKHVIFLVNEDHQNPTGPTRFAINTRSITGPVAPVLWDAMRNERLRPDSNWKQGCWCYVDLDLAPMQSLFIVLEPLADRTAQSDALQATQRLIPLGEKPVKALPIVRLNDPKKKESASVPLRLDNCKWIWHPEATAGGDAPAGTRYFRKTIAPAFLKEHLATFPVKTQGILSADNAFVLYANGKEIGRNNPGIDSWRHAKPFEWVASEINWTQPVTLAIKATNATDKPSPAGLIGRLRVTNAEGDFVDIPIDATWTVSTAGPDGWLLPDFDDSDWPKAQALVSHGQSPWGVVDRPAQTIAPADPFIGTVTVPDGLDRTTMRAYLVLDATDEGYAVTINGQHAGGLIGAPWRLPLDDTLKQGKNQVRIEPYAPQSAQIVFYPQETMNP